MSGGRKKHCQSRPYCAIPSETFESHQIPFLKLHEGGKHEAVLTKNKREKEEQNMGMNRYR